MSELCLPADRPNLSFHANFGTAGMDSVPQIQPVGRYPLIKFNKVALLMRCINSFTGNVAIAGSSDLLQLNTSATRVT